VDPGYRASDSALFTRVMEPLFMRNPGKTVYADSRRMEALIEASGLDWTIVRACWLFNAPGISAYQVCEDSIHGMFTARADLAACLLAQLADNRHAGKTIRGGHDRGHARHPPGRYGTKESGNRRRGDTPHRGRPHTRMRAAVLGRDRCGHGAVRSGSVTT
jgi:NAD(P)H-binding